MVRIVSWNTTSLVRIARRKEVEDKMAASKANIMLLQETHLNDKHRVYAAGKRIFQNNEGVGTAIWVDANLAVERKVIDGLQHIGHTAIILKGANGRKMLVASIYVLAHIKMDDLREDLAKLEDCLHEHADFVLGGDWNASHPKWNTPGDNNISPYGRVLVK